MRHNLADSLEAYCCNNRRRCFRSFPIYAREDQALKNAWTASSRPEFRECIHTLATAQVYRVPLHLRYSMHTLHILYIVQVL